VHVVRKAFSDPPVLVHEDLALEAAPGEFLAVVGPSGAGKSTLLSLLAGLDRNFDGRIEGTAPSRSGQLGMVFQQPRLMPWLSALENVVLVLNEPAEARYRAVAALTEVGLDAFAGAFPRQLSGGMQRRVALARAFAVEPELLLLDEPFSSLDRPAAWQLRAVLLALWSAHAPTVVLVTHDLREALCLADRVLFLSARPASVILEVPVSLARPRPPDGPEIETLERALLEAHPRLLSGILGPDPPAAEPPSATLPGKDPTPRPGNDEP